MSKIKKNSIIVLAAVVNFFEKLLGWVVWFIGATIQLFADIVETYHIYQTYDKSKKREVRMCIAWLIGYYALHGFLIAIAIILVYIGAILIAFFRGGVSFFAFIIYNLIFGGGLYLLAYEMYQLKWKALRKAYHRREILKKVRAYKKYLISKSKYCK